MEKGILSLNHIDGKRSIEVSSDLSTTEVSTKELNEIIEGHLIPLVLNKYPSVSYSKEGESRQNARSLSSIVKVMPIV